MRHSALFAILCCLSLVATSCGSPRQFDQPPFKGFDAAGWRQDRLGCKGTRQAAQAQFERMRLALRGTSQADLITLLGSADFTQLADRNERYLIYFLEKGPQCEKFNAPTTARAVAVRINALDFVTQLTYHNGRP